MGLGFKGQGVRRFRVSNFMFGITAPPDVSRLRSVKLGQPLGMLGAAYNKGPTI